MKGYKGFHKGLICEGEYKGIPYFKQYEENSVFEEDSAVVGQSGMHFCQNPLEILTYYPLIGQNCEMNEFTEVESLDNDVDVKETEDGNKFSTKKLKIGTKLTISDFIKASFMVTKNMVQEELKDVKEIMARCIDVTDDKNDKRVTNAVQDLETRIQEVGVHYVEQFGKHNIKQVAGNYSKQVGGNGTKQVGCNYTHQFGGNYAKQVGMDYIKQVGENYVQQLGENNVQQFGENHAKQVCKNNGLQVGVNNVQQISGDYTTQVSEKHSQQVSGKHSIMVSENGSQAKGGIGSVILMVERNIYNGHIIDYQAIQIDNKTYKEDTWYMLKNGKIVEVNTSK